MMFAMLFLVLAVVFGLMSFVVPPGPAFLIKALAVLFVMLAVVCAFFDAVKEESEGEE